MNSGLKRIGLVLVRWLGVLILMGSLWYDINPAAASTAPVNIDPPPQNIQFERLGLDEGLSQSTIMCILQDAQGFMWFGTQDGLDRFDGYQFKVYRHDPDNEHSLSHNMVQSCKRDKKDNLWFLTGDVVLNRYDPATGHFHHYPLDIESALSGTINIAGLYADKTGRLWIATTGSGLARYDEENDELIYYTHDPTDPHSLGHNIITELYEDSEGTLWIGAGAAGLNKYDPEIDGFVRYPYRGYPPDTSDWLGFNAEDPYYTPDNPYALSSPEVHVVHEDRHGNLWVGTYYGGLNRFDRETEHFITYPYTQATHMFQDEGVPDDVFSGNSVGAIVEDHFGKLWLSMRYTYPNRTFAYLRLVRFDPQTGHIERFISDPAVDDPCAISHQAVMQMYKDQQDNLWFNTFIGGLDIYNWNTGCFEHYTHNPQNPHSLSADDVNKFYQDESGGLWIGTDSGGVNLYDPTWAKFYHHQFEGLTEEKGNNSIFRIYGLPSHVDPEGHANILWVSTIAGLNRWDRQNNTTTFYQIDPKIPDMVPRSLYEDDTGTLWVGTELGLYRADWPSGQESDPETLNFTLVLTRTAPGVGIMMGIQPDASDETLWLAAYGLGLGHFDPATGAIKYYSADPNDPQSLINNTIIALEPGRYDTLWVVTRTGLDHFDPTTESFTHYVHDPETPHSLGPEALLTAYDDGTGTIWIGSQGSGLQRLDVATGTVTYYKEEEGLPNNVIYSILSDGQGNLWLSTNKGLAKFNVQTETFTNYTSRDGLQSNEFNQGADYRAPDGEMFFGGVNGLNIFYPEAIHDNPYIPPIVITDLEILNESVEPGEGSVLQHPIESTEALNLTYQHRVVLFEFAALHYAAPDLNQYAYMMEGFDKDWNEVGNRRFATYTNLPPGTYTFRVKGSNSDGVWNSTGTAIKVKMTPPPWKTWWAYTLYALAAVGLVVGYVRYRTAAQTKELERERAVAERLRRIDRMKDEFMANTSHELRTPLTGIIGLAESLIDGATGPLSKATVTNLRMIVTSGKRLASLVNDILDFSKLRQKDIQLQRQPLSMYALTDVVLTLSQPLLRHKDVKLINAVDEALPLVDADENRVQQIMHNLAGNAIKFTDQGSVIVSAQVVEQEDDSSPPYLAITVSDTGIGIAEENLGRIFKSFEQADGSIEREYGGTGLGLAVTKRLVELHGGTIWVTSKPREGSNFTFTLPLYQGDLDAQQATALAHPAGVRPDIATDDDLAAPVPTIHHDAEDEEAVLATPVSEQSGMFNILIVDDEPVNLQVLTNHLSLHNYNVTQATNGTEALSLVQQGLRPDLVLLDIMMPRMSGYEVCRKLRQEFQPNELPVVMLTAKNRVSDLIEGFNAGSNDYLTKPFSKNELLARIKIHLHLAKINEALIRFVPQEFLDLLDEESVVDVQLGDHAQLEMTVLFSDIRNFTTLSEQMTPRENFDFINAYLGQVSPVIRRHSGFIDKYVGDAIMALFPQQVEDAVQASIAMREALARYNAKQQGNGQPSIQIGIGLHTGDLMLGTIGESARMEGTVISDVVNAAARLQDLTKHYGVTLVLSEQTLNLLPDASHYHYRFLDRVRVKGKTAPLNIYEIFDGDLPTTFTLKQETLDNFASGVTQYHAGDFVTAKEHFERVLQHNPDDQTARFYLTYATRYIEHGTPEGWDGVTELG